MRLSGSRALRLVVAFPLVCAVAAAGSASTSSAGGELPFEGVTLQLAKAPHGEDEQDNFAEWLAPFEEATGIDVEHTVVPWDELEATYTANFAGSDVFDVS